MTKGDQNLFAKSSTTINLFDIKPSTEKSVSKI
jgi:hypothetical protein